MVRVGQNPVQLKDRVLQPVHPLAAAFEGQPGGVELRFHISGAQAKIQPATGELVEAGDLTGQQRGVVKSHVQNERRHPRPLGRLCRQQKTGKGRRHAEVIGHHDHVVAS